MNSVLKCHVYSMGNQRQVDAVKQISGMSEVEQQVFQMLHDYKDDSFIRDTLTLDRKTLERIEASIRVKLCYIMLSALDAFLEQNKGTL